MPPDERETLIVAHWPLVRREAVFMSRRRPPGMEFDDLVSCGARGLIAAVDGYDPLKGSLMNYAKSKIAGAMREGIRQITGRAGQASKLCCALTVDPASDGIAPDHLAYARVEAALGSLTGREREAIGLYFFADLTMREAGERMGVNESRVSQLCNAALDQLRCAAFPGTGKRARMIMGRKRALVQRAAA